MLSNYRWVIINMQQESSATEHSAYNYLAWVMTSCVCRWTHNEGTHVGAQSHSVGISLPLALKSAAHDMMKRLVEAFTLYDKIHAQRHQF